MVIFTPPEGLDVGLVPASMPQQPLVTQPPRSLLLPEHVDKGVHVQPDQQSQTTETQIL